MLPRGKIKYGMIGGGDDSLIGEIHRNGAALDGEIELVGGVFSYCPEISNKTAKRLFIDPQRVYASYHEMLEREMELPVSDRIDFVSILTPNRLHFPVAKEFVSAGINIICEKPITCTIEEADELCRLVKEKDVIFAVSYTYTGYPMLKQARELIRKGSLGEIKKIVVEHSTGWLAQPLESQGENYAVWRTDPKQMGVSCCMADLGSHAENLSYYVTGLEMEKLCADLNSFVPG